MNLTLYVADSGNDRIQQFMLGQSNGTTVAGGGTSGNISLNNPTGVVLDGDGYLFITDSNNGRIVGESSNGFRCLIGCSGSSGSTPSILSSPHMMNFDTYGNIFVVDAGNSRIQKFLLSTNSCGMPVHR
jgi:hypothetical protein